MFRTVIFQLPLLDLLLISIEDTDGTTVLEMITPDAEYD